jgi:hypothetical protein
MIEWPLVDCTDAATCEPAIESRDRYSCQPRSCNCAHTYDTYERSPGGTCAARDQTRWESTVGRTGQARQATLERALTGLTLSDEGGSWLRYVHPMDEGRQWRTFTDW